ncbi:GNAT family N-acetyltransferase [Alkalicella caledoniensis]|uniref:GNAT family N-acetyltransferase n=1 Tax=Alkalicella caledoniensis TaxID=2731377 RepID=A0A7G9W9A9_ALKCA|nr:GNAT family N-acetyltransferase [Alkalicella caledoniensis]QNO15271.1 GNAT family N-acetyltransferase [Alkalicella caledoniensis]
MVDIKIIEYHRGIAQEVADMWNASHEGWGGGDTVRTAEDVHRSESNSENTNLFIAMEGEKAVGYCSLSEYRFDENTMYIPLLNVRPTHHGKKIGKELLLAALNRTIELGWPRLDLFTWPGNTKAVPLYKKCGFFWEDMDESTHLLNLIPTVLKTQAIKDYFQHIDWYNDSTRIIEVKPDGEKENSFEYYQYSWIKGDINLRVQFERRGRGLRLIETDDYLVCATVEKMNLVFGRKYQVEYKVVNKSGRPLSIEIEGYKDKNIDNTFIASQEVSTEVIISNNFTVGEVQEEQSNFKTHPTVAAKIKINGKQALFQIGIVPEFPAKLVFKGSKEMCYINKQGEFYLDIQNKFDEAAEFEFDLPESHFVDLHQKHFKITLEPKDRTSIPINYTLKGFGFYYPKLEVRVTLKNGDIITFTKKIGYAFKGLNAQFYGETEHYWEIYNDKFVVKLEKMDNWQTPTRQVNDGFITAHMPPRIGKPFFDEFAKKKPTDIKFYKKNGSAVLEYILQSDKKKGIQVKTIHELLSNGLLASNYEIINKGYESDEELSLALPVMHNMEGAVIPLASGIVELHDSIGAELGYWESKDLNENWLFAKSRTIPRGLAWPEEYEVEFKGWHLMLTTSLGKIGVGDKVVTKPIYISVGAFSTWQEFRAFAKQEDSIDYQNPIEHITLRVNGGNPFVDDIINVSVEEKKTSPLDGEISVGINGNVKKEKVSPDDKKKFIEFQLKSSKEIDYVTSIIDLSSYRLEKESVVFRKGKNTINTSVIEEQGQMVYVADNGVLQIKTSPAYGPNLYSLQFKGKEWLDNTFPKVGPKSWWNPWQGGLYSTPEGLLLRTAMKETINVSFTQINDQFYNQWEGIKITVKVTEHERFKGLTFHQYYLMLPGSPVLCQLVEIEQNTGAYIEGDWMHSYFFKPNDHIKTCFHKYKNTSGEWVTSKAGSNAFDGTALSSVSVESSKEKNLVHYISDHRERQLMVSTNQEVIFILDFPKYAIKNGETVKFKPNFFVLTDQRINELALKDLMELKF